MKNKILLKKRKKWSKVWTIYFFIILIGIICINFIPTKVNHNVRLSVIASFILNGMFFLYMLIHEITNNVFSLESMHWFFSFFFFFFAALIQYIENVFCWGYTATDEMIFSNNLILTLWGIAFALGNYLGKKNKNKNKISKEIKISATFVNFCLILSCVISAYIIFENGLVNLFSRGSASNYLNDVNLQSSSLLLQHSFSGILTMTAAFAVVKYKKDKTCLFQMIVALLILFLTYPPTGLARYAAATIYIGLLLLLIPKLKKNRLFIFIFLFAFVIIFPTINVFRNISIDQFSVEVVQRVFNGFSTEYISGNYDAYTMLMFIRDYVSICGIAWGKQFLGSILFFVPRNIWPAKPGGTGYTVLTALGHDFANVSAALPVEGYMNFGLIGMIFFGIFVGAIVARLDTRYWLNTLKREKADSSFLGIIYPFLLALFFFMCRGDLMSTYAYMFALVFVGFCMYQICRFVK